MHDRRTAAEEPSAETEIREIKASSSTGALRLTAIVGNTVVTRELSSSGRLTVGRGRANDIVIKDGSISREHAFLELEPLAIIDRGSHNGTYVRGVSVVPGTPVALTVDEPIRLGEVVVVIRQATASPMEASGAGPAPVNLVVECARAARAGGSFALVRVIVDAAKSATAIDVVNETVRVSDQVSVNDEGDLTVLFPDTSPGSLERTTKRLADALEGAGVSARLAIARYPSDGTTPAQLLARTWQQVLMNDGADDPMATVRHAIAQLAAGDLSILLCGETGVGKELFAEIIHRSSPRARGPLIKVNCAALTASLLESEMFGHERGAFTGAATAHTGLIEAADGGTIFLDEVGEIPLELQAKLLRVVEDREVRRVGATTSRRIDVRFVAATNRSLEGEVAAGRFRRDLLFRIAGATVTIPPLRERPGDIEAIARAVIDLAPRRPGLPRPKLSGEALDALREWHWPGNVRELRNTIERAMLVASGRTIAANDLGLEIDMERTIGRGIASEPRSQLPASVDAHEREQILAALEQCDGNKSKAARMLGIARNTLLARLDSWGLRGTKK